MKHIPLKEVQKIFWKNLLSTESEKKSLPKLIEGSRDFSAARRMFIYQEAYYLRILGALREDFCDLSRLMGERKFEKMTREYLDHHPSKHYSLRFIGQRLAGFLKKSSWGTRYPWAIDLATFEWTKTDLFDGPDHTSISRDAMATVPQTSWPTLKMRFIPNLRVLKTQYQIENLSELPMDEEKPVQLRKKNPRILKVWRKDEEIYYSVLDPLEMAMLNAEIRRTC